MVDQLLGLVVHAPPEQFGRYGWLDAVDNVAKAGGCPELRAAAAAERVSWAAVARCLSTWWDAGTVKAGTFVGYIETDLAALWKVSRRVARRVVKVLRAAGFLEGWPPDAHLDPETGRYVRGPSTFRVGLPAWCRSAHWKARESPGGTTGHRWPEKRGFVGPGPVPAPDDARKPEVDATPAPAEGLWTPKPRPLDYVIARDKLGRGRRPRH